MRNDKVWCGRIHEALDARSLNDGGRGGIPHRDGAVCIYQSEVSVPPSKPRSLSDLIGVHAAMTIPVVRFHTGARAQPHKAGNRISVHFLSLAPRYSHRTNPQTQ